MNLMSEARGKYQRNVLRVVGSLGTGGVAGGLPRTDPPNCRPDISGKRLRSQQMKSEEILQVVKERYSKAAQTSGAGAGFPVCATAPPLGGEFAAHTVVTLRRIWHPSRNSLSSY